MRASIIALAIVSVPAHAADQFDLICNGTKEWRGSRPIEMTKVPVEFKLRIDTKAGKFCYDRCETLYSINLVAPKAIFLGGFDDSVDDKRTEFVDRATGEYMFLKHWPDDAVNLEVHAKCSSSDFSGFPNPPTQF